LPTDVFSRYLKARGEDAFSVCGTDEHGTPILVRAIEEKTSPKKVVDYYHEVIKKSLEGVNIKFDIFSRTTREHHYGLTQQIYSIIKREGYTYKKKVKILYCEHDKISLPDRLVKGTCPYCGAPDQYGDHCEKCGRTYSAFQLKNPRCAICGNPPVIKEKDHIFFALSEFSERLEKWVKEDVKMTRGVKEHVLSWIKEGLHDWDISRDINWGVPIPDSRDQVFYVWFDAPIGYISFTKELFEQIGKDWEKVWIEDDGYIVHFIGKDIIYHHALFWPAMLMAAGYNLPRELRVRGFATLEGQKMSKSRRWYIGLKEFVEIWDPDYLRFYWTITTGENLDDGDFSLREFSEKINKILIGEIGNFVHRVVTLIRRGKIYEGEVVRTILDEVKSMLNALDKDMLENQLDKGLQILIDVAGLGNKTLSEKEPWRHMGEPFTQDLLVTLFVVVLELVKRIYSFLPSATERFFKMLNYLDGDLNNILLRDFLEIDGEEIKKHLTNLNKSKNISPLFKKVTEEEIKKARKLFG